MVTAMGGATVSMRESVLVTSALIQWVADQAGIRILHVKGPAAEIVLDFPRTWSDVDVWVDPARMSDFMAHLEKVGFIAGPKTPNSGWSHSVDMMPGPLWGARADVHRRFPGITVGDQAAFERLWADRGTLSLGGYPCTTPDRVGHALLIGLHAARSPEGSTKWVEATSAWDALETEERPFLKRLAADLKAESALGVRWDEFSSHSSDRDREYWTAVAARDANAVWWYRFLQARHDPRGLARILRSFGYYAAQLVRLRGGDPVRVAKDLAARGTAAITSVRRTRVRSRHDSS